MYLTSEAKKQIFREHGGAETATGTSESQIAIYMQSVSKQEVGLHANPGQTTLSSVPSIRLMCIPPRFIDT